MAASKVYFSKIITPENILRLYGLLGAELPGKVAVKVHSGEVGNQNFLHPEMWKPVIDSVGGTVVECNMHTRDSAILPKSTFEPFRFTVGICISTLTCWMPRVRTWR